MGNKILIKFFKDHKFFYMVGIVFMLLASYIQTLFPKVLGNTVDILKVRGFESKPVMLNLLYIILIAVGTFASTYIWRNLVIGNARKLECHLREQLFDHFQTLSPEFYSKRKVVKVPLQSLK